MTPFDEHLPPGTDVVEETEAVEIVAVFYLRNRAEETSGKSLILEQTLTTVMR